MSHFKIAVDIAVRRNKVVTIPQPCPTRQYNEHMGGVDQLDSYLNNLRSRIRREKMVLDATHQFC